jgi:hypothetical protein
MTGLITGCTTVGQEKETSPLTAEQKKILNDILVLLNTTIEQAEEKVSEKPDPTSPYHTLLNRLNKIVEEVKGIEEGKLKFDKEKLDQFKQEAIGIQANVMYPVNRVLEVDVSFGLGHYRISELSREGRSVLKDFAKDVIDIQVENFKKLFPDKQLEIVIKSVGYADETDMGKDLKKELKSFIKSSPKKDPEEIRKAYNKALSKKRAESISKYIISLLKDYLDDEQVIIAEPVIIGLGEAYPYPEKSLEKPYQAMDRRRRICKIHSNIFLEQY